VLKDTSRTLAGCDSLEHASAAAGRDILLRVVWDLLSDLCSLRHEFFGSADSFVTDEFAFRSPKTFLSVFEFIPESDDFEGSLISAHLSTSPAIEHFRLCCSGLEKSRICGPPNVRDFFPYVFGRGMSDTGD
jgi:hypothetical protein